MRTLKQRKYALHFPEGEGRTEQAHAGEADINTIMARANRGEHSDYINKYEPHYGDASGPDFYQAQQLIAGANTMFEDLPSKLRSKFNHDPAQFLEFVQDPKNEDELIELKLAKAKTIPITPLIDQKQQTKNKEDGSKATEEQNEPTSKTTAP